MVRRPRLRACSAGARSCFPSARSHRLTSRHASPPVIADLGTDDARAQLYSWVGSLLQSERGLGAAAPSYLQCSDAVVLQSRHVSQHTDLTCSRTYQLTCFTIRAT